MNLAVNARDAMPNGGSVTIETANIVTDEGAFVRAPPDGHGHRHDRRRAPAALRPVLHDEGRRHRARARDRLRDRRAERRHDRGRLGARHGLVVPRPAAERRGGRRDEPPSRPRSAPAAGSETILLVEDEPVVRQLVAEILETTGYTVLQAGDGPSALELLRRHAEPVDLLVTDVVMPGMSGPEVAKAVTAMRPGHAGALHLRLHRLGDRPPRRARAGDRVPAEAVQRRRPDAKVRGLLDEPAGVD